MLQRISSYVVYTKDYLSVILKENFAAVYRYEIILSFYFTNNYHTHPIF